MLSMQLWHCCVVEDHFSCENNRSIDWLWLCFLPLCSQPEPRSHSSMRWLCFTVRGWAGSSVEFWNTFFIQHLLMCSQPCFQHLTMSTVATPSSAVASSLVQSQHNRIERILMKLMFSFIRSLSQQSTESVVCSVSVLRSDWVRSLKLCCFFLCLTTVVANRREPSLGWYERREELSSC